MAAGDITWFDEAKAYMLDGGWESADDMKVAILDNTTTPTAATATPALADFTQVGSADTYTWSVNTLDRELSDGVVYTVHWNLAASRANPEVSGEDYTTGS